MWKFASEAHIFSEIDHNADEKICWGEFYQWLLRWNVMKDESEDAARSLFTFLDRDGNGTIDAQEMMDALMLLSDFESKHDKTLAVTWLLSPREASCHIHTHFHQLLILDLQIAVADSLLIVTVKDAVHTHTMT